MSTHTSNEDPRPAAQESNRYRQLKSVGARVAKAPQGAASVVHETSRIAYGYTSRTVRDLKRADLRFHTNPVDLAQAITVSAQATIADLAGNAATQIGKAGSKAATKATEVAETAATQMGNASNLAGNAATQIGKAGSKAATKATEVAETAATQMGNASNLAGNAATQIGKAGSKAATKATEVAETAATQMGNASNLAGNAATQIGKAGSKAATKATEVAETAATQMGNAGNLAGNAATQIGNVTGTATAVLLEQGRTFREKCREPFKPLEPGAKRIGDHAEAWAQAAAAAACGALLSLQTAVPSFNDLSPVLKAKFVTAGMHGSWRAVDAASFFYESSVPSVVRNLGKDAVVTFLDGKHASHIEAVVNAPGRVMDAANIVWERASDNLARGAADMTPLELAKANALNALETTGILVTEALQTAAVAGCIGMALEGVVSVSENLIYVYKDEMTLQEARRNVLRDVLKRGKAAAIGGAAMTVVVALGAGPALATAAPVLVSVGGVLYVVSAYSRVKTAWDSVEERPDQLPVEPPLPALGTA